MNILCICEYVRQILSIVGVLVLLLIGCVIIDAHLIKRRIKKQREAEKRGF
jgi:putative Mn2+ efflux pump MntP